MSPRFVLGRENVPCVAEVVNRSLKADCTDFKNLLIVKKIELSNKPYFLQKRKQFFCVNLFSNTQKQNDES